MKSTLLLPGKAVETVHNVPTIKSKHFYSQLKKLIIKTQVSTVYSQVHFSGMSPIHSKYLLYRVMELKSAWNSRKNT